jgi:hypothetical protein
VIYNHASFSSDKARFTGSRMTAMRIRPRGPEPFLESNDAFPKARPQAGFFIMGPSGSLKETD